MGQHRVGRGTCLERQHLDATHRRAAQIGQLDSGLVEIDVDDLRRCRKRLVGLPPVGVGAAVDDIDSLAGIDVVIAAGARHGVVAVARANAVVSVGALYVEALDAAEVDAVVEAPVVAEVDARIAGRQ